MIKIYKKLKLTRDTSCKLDPFMEEGYPSYEVNGYLRACCKSMQHAIDLSQIYQRETDGVITWHLRTGTTYSEKHPLQTCPYCGEDMTTATIINDAHITNEPTFIEKDGKLLKVISIGVIT